MSRSSRSVLIAGDIRSATQRQLLLFGGYTDLILAVKYAFRYSKLLTIHAVHYLLAALLHG